MRQARQAVWTTFVAAVLLAPTHGLASAPQWSALSATTVTALTQEGIDAEMYKELTAGEIVVRDRPLGEGLTGVHVAAFAVIEGDQSVIWDAMADCPRQTEFIPNFEECRYLEAPKEISSDTKWVYNRFEFGFFPLSYSTEISVESRHIHNVSVAWRLLGGDLKVNQGSWLIIPLSENQHVVVNDQTVDVGGIIPDFVQHSLTYGSLPDSMEALRDRIQNPKEPEAEE